MRSPSPCGDNSYVDGEGICIACNWDSDFHDQFWNQFPGYHTLECAVSRGIITYGCDCNAEFA